MLFFSFDYNKKRMGIFSSKPDQSLSSPGDAHSELYKIDRELVTVIESDPKLNQKRIEAETLILEDSQYFSEWLASMNTEKLASVCATSEYIHGAVREYADRLSKATATDPDGKFSLVFCIVLAASEIYLGKRFVSFVDQKMPEMYNADSPSIARGLVVFAARPELAKHFLQYRIAMEKIKNLK